MSAAVQAIDIEKLTESERLELIDALWDSIDNPDTYPPMSPSQLKEMEKRLKDYQENPQQKAYSWDEIKAAIRAL